MLPNVIARSLLFTCLLACSNARTIADGRYYEYEPMCSLDFDHPEQEWSNENVLDVVGSRVTLHAFPRYVRDGELVASASDGGFYTYDGRIQPAGGRLIVALQLTQCDYCLAVGDWRTGPAAKAREYVVPPGDDGSFEFDDVVYRSSPDPERHFPEPDTAH